jgi:DNA-binding SARP family transcriptional activator
MMVGVSVETRRALTRPRKSSASLGIRLLGELQVRRNDAIVDLPASKRTRALLGFLVATEKPESRQNLCDLLWDGPDDPRAALRWSLTKLRPLVNDGGLERLKADREHISISQDDMLIDVHRLDALLPTDLQVAELAEIEEAAGLLQGEFLDGLDLPSCYRFHHWCLAERERWGALRRRVLTLAVEKLQGDPDRALPYARSMVAVDPLSEAAHGTLVALLATLGRRKDAQDHYDYACALLKREMGAPLVGQLKSPASPQRAAAREDQPPTPPAEPRAPLEPKSLTSAPLFGRDAEQQAVQASLAALWAGAASGPMLFLGEPGIGKSRLLAFVADQANQAGARTISARCFEAEAVRPYSCWADALGSAIAETNDPAARRDLALFLPSREVPLSDEGSRTRLFAAAASLLASVAAQRPLVLMIDDLQWIDEGSSSLLHYVLRILVHPARFLFVGAARADEIDDNPWCKRVVGALAQDRAVKRITLAPLGADEAAQFFETGAAALDIAAALGQSGGNPLFLTELASAGRQGLASSGRDLDALIGARIARLDDAERDLIVFASATARDFKPELLGAAMDLSEARLLARIDRLERRGLLRPSGEGRFDFAHDLIRQSTYRGISQPRRRLIHRQIARALAEAAQIDHSLSGELAFHASGAGDPALAVKALIAVGEHCLRIFANTAAIDAAERGLWHLQQLPLGPERAKSHIALLKVKVFAAASPGIRTKPGLSDELRRAVETAELMGLRDEDAAFGWHMISWWSQQENDTSGAREAILRAEELSRSGDKRIHFQQLASTGRCLLEVEFDVPRAREFLGEAGEVADRLKQNIVELDWGRGLIARWDGDLARAQASMRRALTLARVREDRWREMECLVWMAKIAIEAESFGDARAFCDEIDEIAMRIGDGPAPVANALRAIVQMRDPIDGAEPDLEKAISALRALDDKAQSAYFFNQVAEFYLDRGDLESARIAAEEALTAAQAVKRATEIIVAGSLLARVSALNYSSRQDAEANSALAFGAGDARLLSARARVHLDRMKATSRIPTLAQTISN